MTKLKCTPTLVFVLLLSSMKLLASNYCQSEINSQVFTIKEEVLFSECPVYKKKCNGIKEWKSGDRYVGDFKYGKPDGKGIFTWTNGASYEGEFRSGVAHGFGKMIYEDNSVYEGEWKYGLKHGEGAYSFKCGDEFFGAFFEDFIDGQGTILFSNGESYTGNWERNLPEGFGIYSRNDGSQYAGMSKEGIKDGQGMVIWETGDTLKGTWVLGKIEDDAKFIFSDGSTMISYWEDGKIVDEILYTTPNGEEYSGSQKSLASNIIQENFSTMETIESNLQIAWYGFAMEYKANNDFEAAKYNLQLAMEIKELDDENKLSEMLNSQFANVNDQIKGSGVASANKN